VRNRFRLGGYRRLAAVNPDTKPFGIVNSVWGVIAQRDDGDYFRTLGVELTGQNIESGWWSWRIYHESQKAAFVETSFSIPHIFNSSHLFRPNVIADRADQFGASFTLRGNQPLSRSLQSGGDVTVEGAGGDYQYGRGSVTGRAIITPGGPVAVAIEGAAGTSTGSVPLQGRFYLGGPATLRGYSGAVIAGETFWRGRREIASSFPGFRIAAFSDIGWAGDRSALRTGKPLLGTGAGVSLLDGLIRLDLARGMRAPKGWRFDLYFDGRL
jgi:outer membrane translocation and assembly module TamA